MNPRIVARHGTPTKRQAKLLVYAAMGRARRQDDAVVIDAHPRVAGTFFGIELRTSTGDVQPVFFPGVASP